jgi:MEMO1 family protein
MLRKAAVAGTWYPGDSAVLRREVEGLLHGAALPSLPGRLVGLLSPHAGLRYSGRIAAYTYAALRAQPPATVVMVGPSHRVGFQGCRLIAEGAFETPLGQIPIDAARASDLLAADPALLQDDARPHRDEHSLEMQLPFLQVAAPDARIVPILMGHQTAETMSALGRVLARVAGPDVVFLASSDLSHYQPAPVAHELDARVVGDVERFDPDGLQRRLLQDPDHACGGGPLVAVMAAARSGGASQSRVLQYGDSGDAGERDKSRVVGYLAAAFSVGA